MIYSGRLHREDTVRSNEGTDVTHVSSLTSLCGGEMRKPFVLRGRVGASLSGFTCMHIAEIALI